MNLEKHVTSLELSQKLKTLGAPQESTFYWFTYKGEGQKPFVNLHDTPTVGMNGEVAYSQFSAFLASELGEMLGGRRTSFDGHSGEWVALWDGVVVGRFKTETDSRAKLLIHLIEQKIIDPKTL